MTATTDTASRIAVGVDVRAEGDLSRDRGHMIALNTSALIPASTAELDRRDPVTHPVLSYLARLGSENSRRAMSKALVNIVRIARGGQCVHRGTCEHCSPLGLDWAAFRYEHTTALRTALSEAFSPSTANLALSALRGVLKEAWRLGLMDAEPFQRATDLAPVKGSTLPAGRALLPRELQRLFETCDESPRGRRDAAILAVMRAGLRRSEIVTLDLDDYDGERATVTVRHGKGNKDRLVALNTGAAPALAAWLSNRGSEPGPLFYPADGRGRDLVARRMTAQAVYDVCRARAVQAGIKSFSPHDLRRTFVSDMLDAGADIVSVQKLAGHASPSTTARYDRRDEESLREAARLIAVPFKAN